MEVKLKATAVKCKVAMIEPVGGHGGMDYYDFGLCRGLVEAGADVALYTCNETTQPEDMDVRHAFPFIYGSAPAWMRGLRYAWGSVVSVLSAVRGGRRICHFHLFHIGVLETFNIILAKLFFRKVVITSHDVESFVESLSVPKLARWVYGVADGVIAHNDISKSELMAKLNVPEVKIAIIPHGNYLHMLQAMPRQDEARKKFGLPQQAKVVLFFGQIKDVKGLDVLLAAMPEVIAGCPEVMLVIAGKPWKSDFSYYEKQIETLDIQEYCHLDIRYIPDEEVASFYALADVVVLPYRKIYQSGVVLMTMSYGKAVLVSDLPGMTEVVTDNETGFVFQEGDKHNLAEKIQCVLGNEALRNKVSHQGYEHVRVNYAWSMVAERTLSLYEKVLH